MTIYFTTTFFILVMEMIIFCILVIPLPSRWRRALFKFITASPTVVKALNVLKIIFGFIFVLFIDSLNRLQRIDLKESEDQTHHDYNYQASQKANKFYAQRNLYLCGFTLFLSLILERTSTLIINMLKREEELEFAKSETISSTKDQEALLKMEKNYKLKIDQLKDELKELQVQEHDFETLKKQVEHEKTEYERLTNEKTRLELSIKTNTAIN
ncbi:B-cell receptor-associated protein 31-like-domain-containing protein [Pilobolus umbonatus]|nr:B-cell receptor-associated protein 31-like-domain-containing protein [Pilobolus umbonatus]